MTKTNLPREVLVRLPKYLRHLNEMMLQEKCKVSSGELAKKMDITSSQVRRDFGQLNITGHNGFGYLVKDAHRRISEEVGLHHTQKAIVVGAGNIGQVLTRHRIFQDRGFELTGIYDSQPERIGTIIGEHTVQPLKDLALLPEEGRPDIALLTTSSSAAEETAAYLSGLGIPGILNFCYVDLALENTLVENVHIDDGMMILSYRLHHQ